MGRHTPIFVRAFLTLLVVFGTYNPTGVSLWGWFAVTDYQSLPPSSVFFGQILVALVLTALMMIFVRITLSSLKLWGIVLMTCVIGAAYGLLWSYGFAGNQDIAGRVWAVEIAIWLILFIGSSAPQIYRWLMSVFTNQPVHHGTHHN